MIFHFTNDSHDEDQTPIFSSSISNHDMLDGLPSPPHSVSPTISYSFSHDELPPLTVIDYTVIVDRLCYQAIHNHQLLKKHGTFTMEYPSLYWWCIINDSSISFETAQWWKER